MKKERWTNMNKITIPEGDRFQDESKFRVLGTGAGDKLYECWASAVDQYVEQCVTAEREACAKVCEAMAVRCKDLRRAALEMAAENIRTRYNAEVKSD